MEEISDLSANYSSVNKCRGTDSRIFYSRSLSCDDFFNKFDTSNSYSFIRRLIPYPQNPRLQQSQLPPQRSIRNILAPTLFNTIQNWGDTIVEIELDKLDYYTRHNFSILQNQHPQVTYLKNLQLQKQPSPL